ncbi:unnamed protein product [Mucor hiemalis]
MQEYFAKDLNHLQVLQRYMTTNTAVVILETNERIEYKTGGPYEMNGKRDIYVGDIWVMAGQSNMRGHGFLKTPFGDEPPHKRLDHVHLFDSTETWRVNSDPTHALYLSKRTVHHTLPDPTVRNPKLCEFRGASIGPSFGAHYERGVPIGLIASAHGGVSLKDWKRPTTLDENTYNTTLYGAMMDRICKIGGNIAGILWYQGESDTLCSQDAQTYGERFQHWLQLLRADISPKLPVVLVQLGQHRIDVPATIENWKTVQNEQRRLMDTEPYLVGVASLDCGLDDRLHLSKDGLDILGRRLALAASLALRGQQATPSPKSAMYEKMVCIPRELEVHTIKIDFELPENFQFQSGGTDVLGFEVLGSSNISVLRTRIENNSIRLYLTGEPPQKHM